MQQTMMGVVTLDDPKIKAKLETLNLLLDKDPPQDVLRSRKLKVWRGGQSIIIDHFYLPIHWIEQELRKVFGWYQTRNFRTEQIANEVIGHVDLLVWHNIFRQWVSFQGTASVMINQKKVNGKQANPMDLSSKTLNALEAAAPHLLIDCTSNAAKHIGPRFGQKLNREFTYDYVPELLTSAARMAEIERELEILELSKKMVEKYQNELDAMTLLQLKNDGTKFFDKVTKEGKLIAGDYEILRNYGLTLYKTKKEQLKSKENDKK